jgi:hypothetical protein
MILYLLGMTAIFTFLLNLILMGHLLKDKLAFYDDNKNKKEVIDFVLSPCHKNETAFDTEVLATEIIFKGESKNGYDEQ